MSDGRDGTDTPRAHDCEEHAKLYVRARENKERFGNLQVLECCVCRERWVE